MTLSLVAAATTYAGAVAAIDELFERYRAKYGPVTDLQQRSVPFLARALILANRNTLTNFELGRLISDDYALGPLIDRSVADGLDDEESTSATLLRSWFEPQDPDSRIQRLMIRTSAEQILHSESSL
jgi:hypothetical protein